MKLTSEIDGMLDDIDKSINETVNKKHKVINLGSIIIPLSTILPIDIVNTYAVNTPLYTEPPKYQEDDCGMNFNNLNNDEKSLDYSTQTVDLTAHLPPKDSQEPCVDSNKTTKNNSSDSRSERNLFGGVSAFTKQGPWFSFQ
ncbi:hypothetical protein HK099_001050 [Clydaea vesicula]|uniref:Uncharacterized protein n=1 Tax=Clydaea vesicula TaxID=447962 RepID=A0AAD5XSB8_9FUNG|nr:hypothetical protein HK099_001050 [Clydaea vesicula]